MIISKSIIKEDRYGIKYFKIFRIFPNGIISLQYWTSIDTIVKTRELRKKLLERNKIA